MSQLCRWRYSRKLRLVVLGCLVSVWWGVVPTLAVASQGPGNRAQFRLLDVLAAAYRDNPTLRAAREELRTVNETRSQAMAGFLPKLSISGSARDTTARSRIAGRSEIGNNTLGLTLDQTLFRSGGNVAALEVAELNIAAQRARLQATEQSVLLQAVTAFAAVLRDQAVVQLRRDSYLIFSRYRDLAKTLFDLRRRTVADLAQARSRMAAAKADLDRAEADLTASKATFLQVVGAPAANLVSPQRQTAVPWSLDESQRLARQHHPEVLAARYLQAAARQQLKVQKAELGPTVSLQYNLQRDDLRDSSIGDDRFYDSTASLNLTVPLYQGGASRSRVREAAYRILQREQELDAVVRAVSERTTRTHVSLAASRTRLASLKEALESAEIARDGLQQELERGRRTLQDLLDTERDLLEIQIAWVSGEYDALTNLYALYESVGRLDAKSLGIESALDPDSDYQQDQRRALDIGADE